MHLLYLDDTTILYGLGAIKGLGQSAIEAILEARQQGGEFRDLFDFCRRINSQKVNRRVLESLIKAGALDGLGTHRASLMSSLNLALAAAEQAERARAAQQNDLFGMGACEGRVRRPADGRRGGIAHQGARRTEAPADRDRRRVAGVDEAHHPARAGGEGGPAGRRGGIANTFILAVHWHVGKSLVEADLVGEAKAILDEFPGKVPIPIDAVVAKSFAADAAPTLKTIENIEPDEMILDLGPQSVAYLKTAIARAGTIDWNGPVGVFEFDAFANGTKAVGEAIVGSHAFSLAGGGDTIAAINKFGLTDRISYISTAGGASLEFLEGKTLPAVEVLEQRAAA